MASAVQGWQDCHTESITPARAAFAPSLCPSDPTVLTPDLVTRAAAGQALGVGNALSPLDCFQSGIHEKQ